MAKAAPAAPTPRDNKTIYAEWLDAVEDFTNGHWNFTQIVRKTLEISRELKKNDGLFDGISTTDNKAFEVLDMGLAGVMAMTPLAKAVPSAKVGQYIEDTLLTLKDGDYVETFKHWAGCMLQHATDSGVDYPAGYNERIAERIGQHLKRLNR